jgi:hypothetical protein
MANVAPNTDIDAPTLVAVSMLEIDRQQREHGCSDENIAQLVQLLRSPAGT